ncbi:MAG: CRISPR-associated endonuclease Cas3'' [Chloroflexota bacterium]|nr:CRISPR-associated endonuclease Cas3'' [Dehalococcoidia bacterium]MDW8255282.1 CRISPR-associated endonuclease Cas3'' [Chloroflexota bacterium]
MAYAHSKNAAGERQDLVAHLRAVAALAREFAAPFGGGDLAYVAGLWHDLGKFHPAWQDYLLRSESEEEAAAREGRQARRFRAPDHKGAGARLAVEAKASAAALLIQAHHGGLRSPGEFRAWLSKQQTVSATSEAIARARELLPDLVPAQPLRLPEWANDRLAAELFLRLVYSALVDADSIDTERHREPEQADRRTGWLPLATLWERLERDQARLLAAVPNTTVNQVRREVYAACLAAAEEPPGLFRLAVPTGGGKTRSGMAFALRHALQHGLRRVVVAVPYISITEQTASVYRSIFETGPQDRAVLEHHSALELPDAESEEGDEWSLWQRLAAENWDAPVVVTTTVQLFESLFANGRSKTQKVHRLARSVILLDEAQALPIPLLTPLLDVLRELVTHYGATVVLSTATQPAFEMLPEFRDLPARDIGADPARWFRALRRVRYEWHPHPLDWSQIAAILRESPQALAVVNTKNDALALLDALDDPNALHLSTLLCGAHRQDTIEEIARRLREGAPCRVVSTQVVEAGIDLDFPLVVRAFGPLDSVIQAAGRCNREGRLTEGRVVIVEPAEGKLPPGMYRTATGVTAGLVGGEPLDANDPAVARRYYEALFSVVELATDRKQVQEARRSHDFPETARRFRMIDDDTEAVVITSYGTPEQRARVRALVDDLRTRRGNPRDTLRALQPFVVNLRRRAADQVRHFIVPLVDGVGEWIRADGYDPVRGLVVGEARPDELVL